MNFRNLAFTLLLIFCSNSFAGSGIYSFNQIGIVKDGANIYALLQVDGNLSSVPSCASTYPYQLSILVSNEAGKMTYSAALAAVVSGTPVWISYSDTNCGLYGDRVLAKRFDIRNY